jgi:hypothetical protein
VGCGKADLPDGRTLLPLGSEVPPPLVPPLPPLVPLPLPLLGKGEPPLGKALPPPGKTLLSFGITAPSLDWGNTVSLPPSALDGPSAPPCGNVPAPDGRIGAPPPSDCDWGAPVRLMRKTTRRFFDVISLQSLVRSSSFILQALSS